MDLTVLYMAVPKLAADLHPSSVQLLWITDIYGFMLAGLLLTMGNLGDRIGRRRLLLIGAAVFGATSLLAAFATSAPMLIAARALLGVAGATLAPSTLSLLRTMFADEGQRKFAIGVLLASFSLGAAIGPLVGGALLQFFWWGSVFLVAVPVMALLLLLAPRLLPEFRDPKAGRLDLPSAALSLVAVVAVIYGLKETAESGFGSKAIVAITVGAFLGTAFVRRQQTLADPLVDLRLFRSVSFSTTLASMYAAVFVIDGTFLFLSQYLQLVRGQAPLTAALWLLPATGGLVIGSLLAPPLTRRSPPTRVLAGGLFVAACGVGLLTQLQSSSGLLVLVVGSLIMGIGSGVVGALATDLIVGAAPPQRARAASALSETGAELGGALGIAILGSIGLAVYRSRLEDTLPPGAFQRTAACGDHDPGRRHSHKPRARPHERRPAGTRRLECVHAQPALRRRHRRREHVSARPADQRPAPPATPSARHDGGLTQRTLGS